MTIELNTTNETKIQPAYDAAKSALSKAQDSLVKEQKALSEAQAALDAYNAKLDAAATLPKDAAHDGAELEGAVTFYGKRVKAAHEAVSAAQANLDQAGHDLTEAKILDRAEALAAFSTDQWIADFNAEAQEIADRYMADLHEVCSWEAEAISLGKTVPAPSNRARVNGNGNGWAISLDGKKIHAPYASLGLDYLRESIRDTRHDERVAEAQREEGERRRQEAAERKAEQEYAEQAKRFAAGRTAQQPFQYTGGSGARPMVTTNENGEPLRGMFTGPSGSSTVARRN